MGWYYEKPPIRVWKFWALLIAGVFGAIYAPMYTQTESQPVFESKPERQNILGMKMMLLERPNDAKLDKQVRILQRELSSRPKGTYLLRMSRANPEVRKLLID